MGSGDRCENPCIVQQSRPLECSRPRNRGARDKIPWNTQRLSINKFRGRGLKVLLRRSPDAQHDPWELVDPVAVLKAGPQGSLHRPVKTFTEPISLWVICGRAVEVHSEAFHSSDVNCAPRSEDMSEGVPKRATQVLINARVMSTDATDVSGTASGQRVVLSTMVNKYVKP